MTFPINTLAGLLGPSILGSTQLGAAAPNPGNLGGSRQPIGQKSLIELLTDGTLPGQLGTGIDASAPLESALAALPPSGVGPPSAPVGPPAPPPGPDPLSGFGGFFGNLDDTLGSNSKVLGLGLLNQINPYLGLAGLLGSGLLGKNKVF